MILLKDFDIEKDIKFKKVRTTGVGAKIIDIESKLLQTCWTKIMYGVDYSICTDTPELFEKFLMKFDSIIVNHCAEVFDMCPETITKMYRPLLRPTRDGHYFRMPIANSSVLWKNSQGGSRERYNKSEMKDVLEIGHYIRFIIKFKKLYFKDNNLTVQLELIQAEFN